MLKKININEIKAKKLLRYVLLFIMFICISLFSLYGIAFAMGKPNIGENNYIELYDNQYQLFYSSNNKKQGSYVALEDVSPYFIDSIIAAEDKSFYSHYGFDVLGIARAMGKNIKEGNLGNGASTITQQYARIVYLSNDKTWSRKLKEAFIAARFEMYFTKDQILEGYVNTIYFGHGVYGIENAAKFFFNKSAKELTLSEASMLAGVPNAPSYFSPLVDYEAARKRQAFVIERLFEEDYITSEQKTELLNTDVVLADENKLYENTSMLYYKDSVYYELQKLGFSTNEYSGSGLKIYTNLDTTYQQYLSESATSVLSKYNENMQVSGVLVQPFTSKVLAIIGGKDYVKSEYNRAIYNERQIGSTVKPLLYYLALENGFTPVTKFTSAATSFRLEDGTVFAPHNFEYKYADDEITLVNAVGVSDNIYAVKTHLFLGTEQLSNALRLFDVGGSEANASLALGTVATSIFHLTDVYNTFASEGIHNTPYFIERIEDNEGNILYEHKQENEQLFDRDTTLVLNQMLTSTMDSNNISYTAPSLLSFITDSTFAAKTGSTDWDSLVVGYNPYITCGIWVGYDDNSPIENYLERNTSRHIWQRTLNKILSGSQNVWYQPSENIVSVTIDPVTGEYDPNGSIYWFKNE